MADGVELSAGSGGAICSTDDCGAAGHVQRVKLSYSANGVATEITADTKGLQVQQATAADLNATVVGTVTANAGTNLNTSALATETTLGTVHGHVDSIDGKLPALGQALAAASVPVILPAATITTLTPPAAITGFATAALQGAGLPAALGAGGGVKVDGSGTALPVSGTVTANAGQLHIR
jgi:hypothetical protein